MAITPSMQRKGKERKEEKRKGKSIRDTNVSLSDAEHPTQKNPITKMYIFFNDEQKVF